MNNSANKINPKSEAGFALVPAPATKVPSFQTVAANDSNEDIANLVKQLFDDGEVLVGGAISDHGISQKITKEEVLDDALNHEDAVEVSALLMSRQFDKALELQEKIADESAYRIIGLAHKEVFNK